MLTNSGGKPRVYVVILNWNRFDDTRNCLKSLEQTAYPNLKLVVVDNASADGSAGRLQAEFPHHCFIFNRENIGFARGCNVGIREALNDDQCAYVLLINNDATLAPAGLDEAVELAEGRTQVGLVGGKILHSAESKIIWYAGGSINRWRGQARVRGWQEIDHGQYDRPCEVGFVTGGLMLIKRAVFGRVGLLPEEYFFGVEEWDYSLATQKAGFELFYVPSFVAFHKGDGSHWNYDPRYVYNYYRNKLIFQEKYLPAALFPVWRFFFVLYGKYFARRHRQKLINRFGSRELVRVDDLDFAFLEAVRDHGTNILSEKTLQSFENKLADIRNAARLLQR